MFYTSKIPGFVILPEKTRKSRHSYQKMRLLDVLLIDFEQIVSLLQISTLIQKRSSYFVKSQG